MKHTWESIKLRFCLLLARLGILEAHLLCEVCDREVEPDNIQRHYGAFHREHPVARKASGERP